MNIVDNVTRKLKGIFSMLGGEGGFTRLFSFDSPNIMNKIKKLGNSISSIFNSEGNKKWFEKTVGYFKEAEKWAVRIGDALVGAFSLGGAAIATGIAVASAFLTKQLIKINSEMEQFEVSLQTTLGSLTAAKQEMAGIVQFAKETPYQINQVTAAVVKLRAYSMDSKKWLEPLGNAASAFGRDITDAVEMAADAVQGMFRRALSYGIKMEKADFKAGGKYAGMTYADALMMELEKRFKGGMELQAKTLKGIWSNIKDSLYITFQQVTKPFYGVIKQQVQNIYDYLGSDEGQAKLKQLVGVMTDMLGRMLNAAKSVFEYIKTNLVPIAQTTGKAMLQTFAAVSEMVQPLLTALLPLVTALTSILTLLSWIVTQSKIALQIFVAFSAVTKIMKLLGFSVGKLATNMVATNKAATMLSATVKTLGMTVGLAAVAFGAMWAIGNYMEIKNNLKEIGAEIHNVAKGAEQVKDYLKEIGDETGHTLKEMTKIAIAAKEFGHNMPNVIEVASRATGEAQKGFGKNLSAESDQVAEAIGRLAEAFIKEGDSFEQMKAKTEAAGDMLVNLDRISESTGISFDDMAIAIESNRDVLTAYADNIEELTFLIAQFGKAAKEAGVDANVGQFLDVLGELLKPTKEMLLSLSPETWIAKPLKDMDLDALSKSLSDAIDVNGVKSALSIAQSAAQKVVDSSGVVRTNLEEGADYTYDKLKEAAGVIASTMKGGGGNITGTGISPVKPAGTDEKFMNFLGTWQGVAVEIAGSLALFVLYMKYLNKSVYNINRNILMSAARQVNPKMEAWVVDSMGNAIKSTIGKPGFWSNMQVKLDEKMFAKSLGKGFTARIEAAIDIQTDKITKDYDKKIADVEKELKDVRRSFDEGVLNRLNKMGFGRVAQAVPEGMSAEEFVRDFIKEVPEAFKAMTEEEAKIFDYWQDAFEAKINALETKLAATRVEAAEAIDKMKNSYKDLADAVQKGRIPGAMRDLVKEIKDLTKNMRFEAAVLGRFKKGAAGETATTTATQGAKTAAENISKVRRTFGTMFLNIFDRGGFKMSMKFKDGISARNMATTFRGWSRVLSDYLATETFAKARARLFTLTIGPYEQRLFSKLKNMATGKFGIVPEQMQPGYLRPGEGEQYRPFIQKIIDLMQRGSKDIISEIKTVSPSLAKQMATQFEGGEYFTQAHVLETKLDEIARTGEIAKPLVASIDKLTGEIVLLDGHTSTLAAEIKGLKELKIQVDFGNWQELIQDVVKQTGKVFPKITEVRLTNEGKLISAIAAAGRDVKGRFVSGNQYQWTSETAPRLYAASKNMELASKQVVEILDESGKVIARMSTKVVDSVEGISSTASQEIVKAGNRFERLALPAGTTGPLPATREPRPTAAKVEIIRDSSTISKNVSSLTNAVKSPLNWILLIDTINGLGEQYLEPYLQEQAAQGKKINELAAWNTWKKIFGGAVGEAISVVGAGYAAVAMPGVTAATITAAAAVEQAASDLGWAAGGGKMQEGVQMTDVQRGEHWYDWQTIKSIAADLTFNLGRTFVSIGDAFADFGKSVGSNVKKLTVRFGSLLTGGWGKMPTPEKYGAYDITEKTYGKEAADYEKYIDTIKDAKEREAEWEKLKDAEIEFNVERLTKKREAVLGILTERIKTQYGILEDAGKAVPSALVNELARAGEWVKKNVSWGTEITGQLVQDFENGGYLAGQALSAAVDDALSSYDFSSASGFKKFLEDLDTGNVSDNFKKLFEGMDAGQIALNLGIEALRKMDSEFQAGEKQLEAYNEQMNELNAQLEPLQYRMKEIDKDLINLNQAAENIANAFDLGIAINELDLVSDKAQDLEVDIANLNAELARSEMEMLPLQRALDGVQKEFDAIQDAIDKTQEKLDSFMNAPVEGEGAYREQRYQIERQVAQKQHELEQAQRALKPFEEAGLTGSDTYKQAAVQVAALEAELAALQKQLDDLDYARENITSPVEHAKDMADLAQQGAEQSAQAIIDGIKLESDKLVILQQQASAKQIELTAAQQLVDKKQEEIDKINESISQREAELKVIQSQVEADNILLENAKNRAELEQKIKDLTEKIVPIKGEILGIEGMISAQKLVQAAQDYAAGLLTKDQLNTMVDMYNQVAGQISDLTGEKTGLQNQVGTIEFDVENVQKLINDTTANQTSLTSKIDALTTQLQNMIGGVNTAALSKTDLESMFGKNIGAVINKMGTNIAAMAQGKKGAVAAGTSAGIGGQASIGGYANGGIELAKERLALLHGPEAVIPLKNGSVPVTLYGTANKQESSGGTVISNSFGDMTFIVSNEQELEEIKAAILALRQGQTNFFSRANQYPERH
jgi:predicted  nucleic acid-binding Zn-ribbon protein